MQSRLWTYFPTRSAQGGAILALVLASPAGALAARSVPDAEPTVEIARRAASTQPRPVRVAALKKNGAAEDNDVDSEDIFGFTSGTDLPEQGQKAGEISFDARWGKRDGSYSALTKELAVKYMALPDTLFAVSAAVARHDISGVTGLNDRHQTTFQGIGGEIKHRFLDRTKAPFGLAVVVEPTLSFRDETSGDRVSEYGLAFTVALDRELVAGRWYGAINLIYELSSARDHTTGAWEQESTAGVSAAATLQVRPGLFVGAEARYLRAYEGLGLDRFAGEAVYVGPTFNAKLAKCCFVAAAWNVQAWGREAGAGGGLDLANFERHQATFKFGFDF